MPFWSRKKEYRRSDVLAQAEQARARGRHRKAIAKYLEVLAHEPDDAIVHGKLAPLLAVRKRSEEAIRSFTIAADLHSKAGFADRALSVYLQGAGYYPNHAPFWEKIGQIHLERGRKADGVLALTNGAKAFSRNSQDSEAIWLLRQAFEIEPYQFEATLMLARLLARGQDKSEAGALLAELAARAKGSHLRLVRAAQFRVRPSFGTAWRWLKAAFTGR